MMLCHHLLTLVSIQIWDFLSQKHKRRYLEYFYWLLFSTNPRWGFQASNWIYHKSGLYKMCAVFEVFWTHAIALSEEQI